MSEITRVGADLAKHVIQVHAADGIGKQVTNRAPAREKTHRLVCPLAAGLHHCHGGQFQRPPLGTQADCHGPGCAHHRRPTMRFIAIKTFSQQGMLCVHRLREGLKEERTACVNRIRDLLAELGIVVSQSPKVLREALSEIIEDAENELRVWLAW